MSKELSLRYSCIKRVRKPAVQEMTSLCPFSLSKNLQLAAAGPCADLLLVGVSLIDPTLHRYPFPWKFWELRQSLSSGVVYLFKINGVSRDQGNASFRTSSASRQLRMLNLSANDPSSIVLSCYTQSCIVFK